MTTSEVQRTDNEDFDQWMADLRKRNEEKRQQAREWLGPRWIGHKDRQVQKQEPETIG